MVEANYGGKLCYTIFPLKIIGNLWVPFFFCFDKVGT